MGKKKKGKRKKKKRKLRFHVVSGYTLLVPARSSLARSLVADCTTHELLQHTEKLTRIPRQRWYCRVNGSPLPEASAEPGLRRDCTVVVCARLRGGAPGIPGGTVLPSAPTGRMLASAHTLFQVRLQERANKHFAARSVNVRQWDGRHPRRVLLDVQRSVGLLSSRGPENLPMQSSLNMPFWRRWVPWVSPVELVQQLRDTWAPPAPQEKPAKRLLDLEIKLDKVRKEAERLNSVVSNKQEELLHAQGRFEGQNTQVQQVLAAN